MSPVEVRETIEFAWLIILTFAMLYIVWKNHMEGR